MIANDGKDRFCDHPIRSSEWGRRLNSEEDAGSNSATVRSAHLTSPPQSKPQSQSPTAAEVGDSRGEIGDINDGGRRRPPSPPRRSAKRTMPVSNLFPELSPSSSNGSTSPSLSISQQTSAGGGGLSEEYDSDGNVLSVGDLAFAEGTLGTGAYGTVRLARRNPHRLRPSGAGGSVIGGGGGDALVADGFGTAEGCQGEKAAQQRGRRLSAREHFPDPPTQRLRSAYPMQTLNGNGEGGTFPLYPYPHPEPPNHGLPRLIGKFGRRVAHIASSTLDHLSPRMSPETSEISDDTDGCEKGELVAVKVFSKSVLKRMRTLERDSATRKVEVHTALEKVEREIALMKMMTHPNVVCLHEVIDSEESDALYMVLEYMPLGEILTFHPDSGTFRRRVRQMGEPKLEGVVDGHFDEYHAALYFVDILHGLAYLHQHHICHCDLKPENILLDARGYVKISDFGVSHIFEDDPRPGAQMTSSTTKSVGAVAAKATDSSSSAITPPVPLVLPSPRPPLLSLGSFRKEKVRMKLTRHDTDSALAMSGMSSVGMLTKTEGTWCFWSPEMCAEEGGAFSGYAADLWAAGVCLYIFVTGHLPFFSDAPIELFNMIAGENVSYEGFNLSKNLVDLLKRLLEKDANKRAGVGDSLKHPFLQRAREQRIVDLDDEFEKSVNKKLILGDEDIRKVGPELRTFILPVYGEEVLLGVQFTEPKETCVHGMPMESLTMTLSPLISTKLFPLLLPSRRRSLLPGWLMPPRS